MRRAPYIVASIVGLAALPTAALAQSETTASAEVTASTGYSSNPFAGTGGGAGFAELRVRPTVRLRTERDTFTLLGDAELQQYFRRYGTRDNYNARLNYIGRRSDRLTLTGGVNYLNAISGSSFTGAVVPELASPEPPVAATDLGLFGTGNRRQTISGQAGATLLWSAVDQINAYGTAISTSNSQRGQAVNYHGFGGGLGYSRRLNEAVRVGLTGAVNTTNYSGDAKTTVYSAEGTFDARLDERWSLNGSVGLSRLDSSNDSVLIGSIPSQTTLSGFATICRLTPTGQLCLGLSRAILPSSFGGARVQSTIDASYRAKLGDRSSVTARSAYTDVNGSDAGLFSSFRYWSNTLGYQYRLGERLGLSATALYRTISGGSGRQSDDVGGTVGLAYTLGKNR